MFTKLDHFNDKWSKIILPTLIKTFTKHKKSRQVSQLNSHMRPITRTYVINATTPETLLKRSGTQRTVKVNAHGKKVLSGSYSNP